MATGKTYDLTTTIKTLRGKEVPVFFPTDEQRDVAVGSDKKLDVEKLPRETIQDVLMTVLEHYPADDRKTTFLVQNVGQLVIANPKPELMKVQVDFIGRMLDWATIREEEDKDGNKKTLGIYPAWKTAQVYNALGITE